MNEINNTTAGLASDKLKAVLEFVWSCLQRQEIKGVIFAYDEMQTFLTMPRQRNTRFR